MRLHTGWRSSNAIMNLPLFRGYVFQSDIMEKLDVLNVVVQNSEDAPKQMDFTITSTSPHSEKAIHELTQGVLYHIHPQQWLEVGLEERRMAGRGR